LVYQPFDKNGDITTHYSATELAEIITAVNSKSEVNLLKCHKEDCELTQYWNWKSEHNCASSHITFQARQQNEC